MLPAVIEAGKQAASTRARVPALAGSRHEVSDSERWWGMLCVDNRSSSFRANSLAAPIAIWLSSQHTLCEGIGVQPLQLSDCVDASIMIFSPASGDWQSPKLNVAGSSPRARSLRARWPRDDCRAFPCEHSLFRR